MALSLKSISFFLFFITFHFCAFSQTSSAKAVASIVTEQVGIEEPREIISTSSSTHHLVQLNNAKEISSFNIVGSEFQYSITLTSPGPLTNQKGTRVIISDTYKLTSSSSNNIFFASPFLEIQSGKKSGSYTPLLITINYD